MERPACRIDAIRRLMAVALEETESFEVEPRLTADLLYLVQAIANGDQVDWSVDDDRPFRVLEILKSRFPRELTPGGDAYQDLIWCSIKLPKDLRPAKKHSKTKKEVCPPPTPMSDDSSSPK